MIDDSQIENVTWSYIELTTKRSNKKYYKLQLMITLITGEVQYYTYKISHPVSQYIRRLKNNLLGCQDGIPREYWDQIFKLI